MNVLALHCPLHGLIMSWPDYALNNDHPQTCWMIMVDGTKCGLVLSLQVWPYLTPHPLHDKVDPHG